MPYPWASIGGFMFKRDETPIYGSDFGWNINPTFTRDRPLGTATDTITTLSVGSMERSFEVYLSQARFAALLTMVNTKALFTDWQRPVPDSRQAFLAEVSRIEQAAYSYKPDGKSKPKIRTRITLISS